MKCSNTVCKNIAKKAKDMSLKELSSQLNHCNACLLNEPIEKRDKMKIAKNTRGEIGAQYSLQYFAKMKSYR